MCFKISTLEAAERQTAQELVQLKSEISLIISNSSDLLQLLEPNVMTSSEPKNVEALATLVTSLSKLQLDKQYTLHGARESLQNLRTRQAGLQALLRQERDRIFASKQRDEELNSEKETKMRAIVTKLNQLRRSEILEGEFADEAMFTPDASVETVIQHAEILTATVSEYKLSHRDAVVYQKKLEKLRVKNNGSCPCCNQKMDAAVTSSFQSNVEKIFRSGGANRTDADYDSLWTESAALVASLRALEKQLQATAPLKEEILKSQLDMSTMELQLREIGQAEVTSRDNVLALETLTGRLEKAHSSLSDSRVRWTSIVARTLEHQEKRRRYGQDGILSGARSIEDIETEQRQRMEQKDALQSRKEKIAGDEALLTKKFYSVKSSLAEAEKTQLEASTKKRQQGELEDANKTLQARSEEVDTWVQALTLDIAKSNQSLSDLQNRLKQVQSVHQDKDRAFSNKVNEISSEIVALRKMVTVIEDLDSKCNSSSVDEIDSQMQQNALAIHTKEEQIQSLLPRVTSLTSEMAMQERTKKQVRDNLDCRACLEEHEQLQRQWRIAEQRSGGGIEKLREAQRENQRAQQERQRYISEQDKLKGNLEVYSRQKKELQAKLNGPNYRGVEGRFQKKNIEYETTMLAVADLASYSEAL